MYFLSQNSKIIDVPRLGVLVILKLDQVVLDNSQLDVLLVKFLEPCNRNSTEALVHIGYKSRFVRVQSEYLGEVSVLG